MSSWDSTLSELRGEFLSNALQRVAKMRWLVEALARDPGMAAARDELRLHFHGLAGAGTTYGFPEVTRLGLAGERLSVEDAAAVPALQSLLDSLELALGLEAPAARPEVEERPPTRFLALVVEDDDLARSLLKQRLEQEGHEVRAVASRGEADAAISERLPDAIISDVVLPDGSGYELVKSVRQRMDGDEIAILMVSVRSDFLDKVQAISSGADGFFEKPVDWDGLLRRLQHLLDRRRLDPPRILCVEDFEEQASFVRKVLVSAGYEVRIDSDPRRFDAELTAFRPDLILMDVLLPGVSGYDLTRYLRQHPRFASLPVVFLTTEAQPEARIQGLRAGGDDFLVKPVNPALLLSAVAAHLERARLLRSLMERDGLTRLMTHSAFLERAKDAFERARRRPEFRPALVMLDLDRFKSVNDNFGHGTGDRVLVAFASLLRRRLRHSDVLGRYGGEEFGVLLEGLTEPDAVRVVEQLRADFGALPHATSNGGRFNVTVSAGIACLDPNGMTFEDWKKAADDALYRAKTDGRDRVVLAPRAEAPLP